MSNSNESKTENLVRTALRRLGYYADDNIIIEEKKSDNPRINKLLRNASKKGDNQGYPEFIIRSIQYPNLLIVIECKAETKYHQSKDLQQYSSYAVDGAILYSSFLSKEYDVIAIGVSGQEPDKLKITHYLLLNNSEKHVQIFGNELLSYYNYYTNYIINPQKVNKDYLSLLKYSHELNENLHEKRIPEAVRSLLISGILIALQNDAFKSSYSKQNSAQDLADSLVLTITKQLANLRLPVKTIDNLTSSFVFIQSDTTLTDNENKEYFISLIDDIDNNLNTFLENYKHMDTIGQIYIEFLRYANNDKALGIVLTPKHITDLFAEIANLNRNSIVIDNCCGTGGFLISAMKYMEEFAKGNIDTIKYIRENQLIGIEYHNHIYTLAVTNMILHKDGKTNIYKGDCFKYVDTIKTKFKPTVGLLNPPYKDIKQELEFVLNNLEYLEQNGTCIAIVPMRCALAESGIDYELKDALLKKHTLEAVMSMPDELFHNQEAGVVTCIMVFTAHVPHPKGKKTWFGFWKNDGFVKMKNRGRIDRFGNWEETKQRWISAYRNREIKDYFSLMEEVDAKKEWCFEAYVQTDYSKLTRDDFTKSSGIMWLIIYWLRVEMMIEVQDYFDVVYGVDFEYSKMIPDKDGINFVSRQGTNNGVVGRVRIIPEKEPNPANTISVAGGGSVMESFLQKESYYSGRDLFYLIPKNEFSDNVLLYYCMCLTANKYWYNYGRQSNKTLKKIKIPSIEEIPSWVNAAVIPTKPTNASVINDDVMLNKMNWKTFTFNDIFAIQRGKSEYIQNMKQGTIPYVSASSENNGVTYFVVEPNTEGNKITLAYDGSIGEAFYQPIDFFASEKIAVLDLKNHTLNVYLALFLVVAIRQEKFRFNYGYKWSIESRMKDTCIRLPAAADGSPDWSLMEKFIKSLPYSVNL